MPNNAYVLLVLTTLFWGGNAIAGKLAVGHVSPMLLTTLRWSIAVLLLAAIAHRQLRRDWPVIRRHFWFLAGLGAVGFALFNAAMYQALEFTSAINVSIEQAGMPMVVFLANFLLFSMRVSWAQILGFVLSLVGIALTATHGDLTRLAGLDVNFGDLLMLFAVLFYGGYTVAVRFRPALDWRSTMLVMAASALVVSIPFSIGEALAGRMIWPDAHGWSIAAYTAIFPSLLSQVFFIRGVGLIGSNRASLFINLVPIFGTLLSVLLLGEDFRPYHALAMALVLGGIWLAERRGRVYPA